MNDGLPERDTFAWLVVLLEQTESNLSAAFTDPATGCFISPGEMAVLILDRHTKEIEHRLRTRLETVGNMYSAAEVNQLCRIVTGESA